MKISRRSALASTATGAAAIAAASLENRIFAANSAVGGKGRLETPKTATRPGADSEKPKNNMAHTEVLLVKPVDGLGGEGRL